MSEEHAESGEGGPAPVEPSEEMFTLAEAVEFLGTSRPTMYRWLERGDVKGLKVGKQRRFRKSDLVAYMERGPLAVVAAPIAELETELAFFDEELRRLRVSPEEVVPENVDTSEGKTARLGNQILTLAVRSNSSDIHMEPVRHGGESYLLLRIRTDGVLHEVRRLPVSLHEPLTLYYKQEAGMDVSERRLPQDGRIHRSRDPKAYEFRVACMATLFGEATVMRILDRTIVLVGLDELGMSPEDRDKLLGLLRQPNGLILVTGPTGSGKTTLLYSCLERIANLSKKAVTVEEYVEHVVPETTPFQLNKKAGLTAGVALRALMRHDPDVIMIGESLNLETAQLAQMMSLTGHLVLAPLAANSAADAIRRLVDLGAEPYTVSATVIGVVCQRLARRICLKCREEYEVASEDLRIFGLDPEDLDDKVTLWRGRGCEKCRNTGYRGRIGLYQVLLVNEALAEAIVRGATAEEINEIATEGGLRTMAADGLQKCLDGMTTPSEVRRATFFRW